MPMNPAELERRVRQHDNDLAAIYEIVSSVQTVQQEHGHRLETLTEKVIAHDTRFDTMDSRLDSVDSRLGGVETKLDSVLDLLQKR